MTCDDGSILLGSGNSLNGAVGIGVIPTQPEQMNAISKLRHDSVAGGLAQRAFLTDSKNSALTKRSGESAFFTWSRI